MLFDGWMPAFRRLTFGEMMTLTKEQWLAIKSHDASYDGRFYYTVKNGKTFCRPSCTSRSCAAKNVIIIDTMEDAVRKGYRPCSRCHPELEHWEGAKAELSHAAEKLLRERYADKFSLDALANELHTEKTYLARTFKAVTGRTPLEYHNRIRCEKARELLTSPEVPVSYIASQVGYVSASHFTQVFRRIYGVTPSQFRDDYLTDLDG